LRAGRKAVQSGSPFAPLGAEVPAMSSSGSVTHWIGRLKAGDPEAAQRLWEGYFRRMVRLARRRLRGRPRPAADEEDVALSAFEGFCRAAREGRFARLLDRGDLWQLLVVLTARKALALVRHERRQKRGGDRAKDEAELDPVIGREPTPGFAAQVAEECARMLRLLPDQELRSIAVWKMEGYGNEEIAARLGCVERTVERRLRVIRALWGGEVGDA
jgi:DNA-directed RNA polymerase specialized sigma24 family protein